MNPFDAYPQKGRVLLGRPKRTDNCRRGYGLELQQVTGQTSCAYCDVDLVHDYYRWLLMSVDHVVPSGEAVPLGISALYCEDFINLVICCAGCNGFDNRYRLPLEPKNHWELEEFLAVRNDVFQDRRQIIEVRRVAEQQFFLSQPWQAEPRAS